MAYEGRLEHGRARPGVANCEGGTVTTRAKLPATVVALGLTSFFTDVASEMAFPLLPAFLAGLGAGPAFLGALEGVADAIAAGLKYASGRRSDVGGGRKRWVLVGYGLASAVRPLLAVVTSAWQVLAVRAVDRVGKGLRTAPRDALLSAAVPEAQSGRAFGFHRAMDHAGAAVGPLLATALLWLGVEVRTIFLLTLVPGLLAMASVLVVREGDGAPPPPVGRAAPPEALPRRLTALLGWVGLFALANASDAFLLLRATEVGVPAAGLPALWLLLHVSKVWWTARGGAWADRYPRHRLVLAGWGVYAAAYAGFAAAVAPWQVALLFAGYGAFAGLTEPAEKALVRQLSPEGARGRAFGLYHGLLGAAAIPAGLLTGGLWQAFGAPAALLTSAAVTAAAGLGLWRWSRAA